LPAHQMWVCSIHQVSEDKETAGDQHSVRQLLKLRPGCTSASTCASCISVVFAVIFGLPAVAGRHTVEPAKWRCLHKITSMQFCSTLPVKYTWEGLVNDKF
jgi:hypothetical protein